jgi:hypothetical protein
MRVVFVSWNHNSSEMCASEKHEMKVLQGGINPESAHMYQGNGNGWTRKCSEMHRRFRHSKCGYFLQKILLVVFFRSSLLILEYSVLFVRKAMEVAIIHAGTPSLQLEPACGWLVSPDYVP